MKVHSQEFKTEIATLGKQQDVKITYENNVLTSEDINSVTPNYKGDLLKSVMKELEIDSNINIPLNTEIRFEYGLFVNNEYEYINYGNYVVYEVEKQEDTNSYRILCYDKLIYSMREYKDLEVTYPITLKNYLKALCSKIGLQFKDTDFANQDRMINDELYLGLDYTYRDVLDEIAQATGSTIFVNINDELEVGYPQEMLFYKEISGTEIKIEDALSKKASFQFEGRSTQETRQGYNFLNISQENVANIQGGATNIPTFNDDSIVLNGKTTSINNSIYYKPITLTSGTYTLLLNITNYVNQSSDNFSLVLQKKGSDGTYSTFMETLQSRPKITKTVESGEYRLRVYLGTTATYSNTIIKPMLYLGSDTKEYEPYGAMPSPEYSSEIKSVDGWNKFDETQLLNASGWTKNDDGYYTGTAQDLVAKFGINTDGFTKGIKFEENTQYTITCDFYSTVSNGNNRFHFEYTDGTNSNTSWNDTTPTKKTVTSTAGKTISKICFNCNNNARITYFKDIQLTKGTTQKPYQPHGHYIGEVIQNKNMWNEEIEKGWISTNGALSQNDNRTRFKDFKKVKSGESYYLSSLGIISTENWWVYFYDENKQFISYKSATQMSSSNNIFETPSNCKYIKGCIAVQSSTISEIMLVESQTPTEYAPHQETNITIPLQQPFRSIEETRDCFEKKDGKWYEVHKIGEVVIDGINLKLIKNDSVQNSFLYFVDFNHNSKDGLCNYFKYIDGYPTGKSNGKFNIGKVGNVIYFNGYGIVSADNATLNNASEFNNWASSHNIEVIYPLSEPIYLECTEEQVQALNKAQNIKLYEGINYISSLNETAPETKISYAYAEEDGINEEYLKDVNVNFGEKYGPINSVVLSRSGGSDNVYLADEESIEQNGLCEIKISDNQIMNWNDRSDYLPELLEKLDGIEYYLNDFTSTGIMIYDLLDYYNVHIGDTTYKCLMLNDEQDITQGLEEQVYTEMPEETETDYTKADKTDRRINQTYLIVDKQNQKIESLASKVEDLEREASGTVLQLEECMEGPLLELHIYGNNTVFEYLYPDDTLYPDDNLYPYGDSRIKVTDEQGHETIYELGVMDVLRQKGTIRDEYVLKGGVAQIIRRLTPNGTELPVPYIEDLGEYSIQLGNGSNKIEIVNYTAQMYGKYAIKSDLTDVFATKVEVQSSITQTADQINLEVRKKVDANEIISRINQSAEEVAISANKISMSGKTLNLADNMEIVSNNFKVDSKGNMTANNGNFIGGKVRLTGGNNNTDMFRVESNQDNSFTYEQPGGAGYVGTNGRIDIQSARNVSEISYINIEDTNGWTEIQGSKVTTPRVIQTSLESIKKNFEKVNTTLDIIKKSEIYKYNLKSEKDTDKKHYGFVIPDEGGNYITPEEVMSDNGIDSYTMCSILWKAVQELTEKIERLEEEKNG